MMIREYLPREKLEEINAAGFPLPPCQDGQVWYDCVCERHGILIDYTLFFVGGGFSSISPLHLAATDQYLYQPEIAEFLHLLPHGFKVEKWDEKLSIKFKNRMFPVRLVSSNVLGMLAEAWLMTKK